LRDLGEARVEDDDGVPLGALPALARGLVAPRLGGGEPQVGDRLPGLVVPDLGIAAEMADENDLVDSGHQALSSCAGGLAMASSTSAWHGWSSRHQQARF